LSDEECESHAWSRSFSYATPSDSSFPHYFLVSVRRKLWSSLVYCKDLTLVTVFRRCTEQKLGGDPLLQVYVSINYATVTQIAEGFFRHMFPIKLHNSAFENSGQSLKTLSIMHETMVFEPEPPHLCWSITRRHQSRYSNWQGGRR
jgi:hypothetical protein